MGRGVDVPMIVIFIGAIGGFITYGLLASSLSIRFPLSSAFLSWLNDDTQIVSDHYKFSTMAYQFE
jgi:hypothetical protein